MDVDRKYTHECNIYHMSRQVATISRLNHTTEYFAIIPFNNLWRV